MKKIFYYILSALMILISFLYYFGYLTDNPPVDIILPLTLFTTGIIYFHFAIKDKTNLFVNVSIIASILFLFFPACNVISNLIESRILGGAHLSCSSPDLGTSILSIIALTFAIGGLIPHKNRN